MNLNIFTAFIFGVLAFLSPCTFPLVPSFLSFLLGISVDSLEDQEYTRAHRNKILLNVGLYILGSCLTLLILGSVAGSIGYFLKSNRYLIQQIGGIFVIIFGLYLLNIFHLQIFDEGFEMTGVFKYIMSFKSKYISLSSFLLGIVFTLGWIPCISVILGAILILAASSSSVIYGSLLLFVYALGLNLPLLFFAFLLSTYLGYFKFLRRHVKFFSNVTGGLMIILGLILLSGMFSTFISSFYGISSRL